jgi:glycosyltransferase involved in cell wall biosynthesis
VSNKGQVKVSLGVPVYNGERFVAKAIQSSLDQTFTDFEVIVCDNASTDRTQEICEEFARKDSRIRYFRQEINIGAKANFNRVFEYSRGEYFKWVAADDGCGSRYLELTVAALDQNPIAVLAHTLSQMIDSKGNLVTPDDVERGISFDEGFPVYLQPADRSRCLEAALPHRRFQEVLLGAFWCFEIFALIRREATLLAYPKQPYYGSDKVMLAQLSLLGQFVEVPTVQFFRRAHHGNSTNLNIKDRENWSHSPKTRWKLPTQFPCLRGYATAAFTFPLSVVDRLKCLGVIARFLARPDRHRSLAPQMLRLDGRRKIAGVVTAPTHVH